MHVCSECIILINSYGYIAHQDRCIPVECYDYDCASCAGDYCYDCLDGFYNENGTCIACTDSYCSRCNDATTCSKCMSGSTLIQQQCASSGSYCASGSHCQRCRAGDHNYCITCPEDYVWAAGKCTEKVKEPMNIFLVILLIFIFLAFVTGGYSVLLCYVSIEIYSLIIRVSLSGHMNNALNVERNVK